MQRLVLRMSGYGASSSLREDIQRDNLSIPPWECFTAAHSSSKAGLFIGKEVETTIANAEDPRESPTVDNARFHPHQDADPEKPQAPAMIDGLIALKNNDHGAWAKAGDIIFCNSSDGTFPTDGCSSLEVTRSIFVGESSNFGSQRGQNSYWGKGAHGEHRTLPKTFPTHGFQIYDEYVRMARCTFKKLTLCLGRYSRAIVLFMKNPWQISPQNEVSQTPMDKNLYIQARCPRNLALSIARAAFPPHPARLPGVKGSSIQQCQPVVMLQQDYILQWYGRAPEDVILDPSNFNR